MPIIFIAIIFFGMGSFGSSCSQGTPSVFDFSAGEDSNTGWGSNWTTGWGSSYDTTSYQVGENLGEGNASDTWTVLMYMCGSDLESTSTRLGGGQATNNLIELTKANLGNNVTFAVETGGARKWQNNVVDSRYLCRYTVEQNALALQDRKPSASMAEASTFADFLSWGTSTFPADHYMVVIWDHGGGSITGVCQDELYPGGFWSASDSLTLTEMRDALKSVDAKFDIIGFDTCLMATVETADILSPYGTYMVASEESEPGSGWDYTTWPTWLGSHPGTSGADLGTVICQSYYNKCRNERQSGMATLSVIDLAKASKVADAFERASGNIARATVDASTLRRFRQNAGRSESYGEGSSYSMNMVDLADLMSKTSDTIGKDADRVIAAIDDAIVFEAHGRNRSASSGLSVFYPLKIEDRQVFYRYAEVTTNTPYLQFLGVMYGVYDDYDWSKFDNFVSLTDPPKEDDMDISYKQEFTSDGHLNLQITDNIDQVAAVRIELFVYLESLDILCYLGSDNDLNGSYDEGWFSDNFQDDWLAIDGHYVCPTLSEEGDGYNLYYIPIKLNDRDTGLIVEYDYSTNEYGVLCVWDEGNPTTGMAGKTGQLLQEGDLIQFMFPAANATTGVQNTIPLDTMVWHEDAVIAYEGLGDGVFAYRYSIIDVLGNVHETELAYQRIENGRRTNM